MSRNLVIASLVILVCMLVAPLVAKTDGRIEAGPPKTTVRTVAVTESRIPNPESRPVAIENAQRSNRAFQRMC